jgi:hypothetical protein
MVLVKGNDFILRVTFILNLLYLGLFHIITVSADKIVFNYNYFRVI